MDLVTENVTLMHGDCLQRMTEMVGGGVDLVLCDPPYGTTQNKWDSVIPLPDMWAALNRFKRPDTPVVLSTAEPFTSNEISSNYKEFRYDLIWRKPTATGFLNANRMPLRAHENIVVFYGKLPLYNPQKTKGKPYSQTRRSDTDNYGDVKDLHHTTVNESGDRFPVSVLEFTPDKEKLHPTQKPVALMEYLIKTFTNPGDTVLDFTMGSGTTGVAAVNTGRKFIGIELDPTYYGVACGRIMGAVNANP